jgi:PIN domain nuclease of toxin-antitoxin system
MAGELAPVHVLLDTCALLWLVGDPARLSAKARAALESTENDIYVSAISGFEISVKHRKGKLELPLPPREWLTQAFAVYSLRELPVTLQIAALSPEVAVPHADPCDRMIVATAQLHRIPVMTSDPLISVCKDIEIIW